MQIFFSIFWWIYFCIFFSGYPLIYLFFYFVTKNKNKPHSITVRMFALLPLTYAFVASCFWILMICTGKIHFINEKIVSEAPSALVILYSLFALLFWLPVLRKNTNLSFVHSLPLFLLPFFNMLLRIYRHKVVDHDYIISMVKLYTPGIIIYIIAIVFLLLSKWLFAEVFSIRKDKGSKKRSCAHLKFFIPLKNYYGNPANHASHDS